MYKEAVERPELGQSWRGGRRLAGTAEQERQGSTSAEAREGATVTSPVQRCGDVPEGGSGVCSHKAFWEICVLPRAMGVGRLPGFFSPGMSN